MKYFIYSILLIVCLIFFVWLYLALLILNIPFTILFRLKGRKGYIMDWCMNALYCIDVTGNGTFYPIWNALWVKDDNLYPFGDSRQTISHVMGWNRAKGNLTWFGEVWAKIINGVAYILFRQKDHLEDAKLYR